MPEFILDHGSIEGTRLLARLDSFTCGYIEAMFFTSTGTGDDAEGDLEHASVAELAPEAVAKIESDCATWQETNATLLDAAYETGDYDAQKAGHDFWYTRNGHGTGYWDRGLGDVGEALAAACRYRDVYLYRGDDGLLYIA